MTAPVIQYQYSAGGPLSDSAVSYNTTSDSNGYTSQQMSLYGSVPTRPSVLLGSARLWQPDEAATAAPPDYHGGFGNAQIGYRHDAASNQLTGRRRLGGRASARRHLRPDGGESFAIVRAPGPPAWRCKTATMCTPTGAAMPWCLPTAYRKMSLPSIRVDGRRHRRRPAGADRDPRRRRGGDGQLPDPHWQPGAVYPAQCPGRYRLAPVRGWSRRRRAAIRRAAWWPTAAVYLSGVPQEEPAVSWIVNNQSQSCTLHFHLPDNPQQSLNTVKPSPDCARHAEAAMKSVFVYFLFLLGLSAYLPGVRAETCRANIGQTTVNIPNSIYPRCRSIPR